jgi:hypothetical protein
MSTDSRPRRTSGYNIVDEPVGGSRGLVVRPYLVLLGAMLGGAWLAWPWFVYNSIAMSSPTRDREILLVGAGAFGSLLISMGILHLIEDGLIGVPTFRYLLIVVIVWKLAFAYAVTNLQLRCFDLYEYFGHPVQNGIYVVICGFIVRGTVVTLFDSNLWTLVSQ